ncbi:hypothetical protein CHCC20335_3437 [Bacillus paralicheniformis]|nr:hypothetical protein CHCC20335_3437 [Bacillus paralicheniformis]
MNELVDVLDFIFAVFIYFATAALAFPRSSKSVNWKRQ